MFFNYNGVASLVISSLDFTAFGMTYNILKSYFEITSITFNNFCKNL